MYMELGLLPGCSRVWMTHNKNMNTRSGTTLGTGQAEGNRKPTEGERLLAGKSNSKCIRV